VEPVTGEVKAVALKGEAAACEMRAVVLKVETAACEVRPVALKVRLPLARSVQLRPVSSRPLAR
jgi:hypothetical protein